MILLYNLLLVGSFISALTLAIIAPFFPPLAEQNGLSTDTIGLILSANPFGAVIASLLLGYFLNKNNRGTVIITGLVLQAIGLSLFIFTEHLSNNWLLTVTILARIIQGVGVSAFLVPSFAYIPLLFPDEIEMHVSQLEACTGVGYIVGPLVGGLFYNLGGYKAPFVFFSLLLTSGIPILHTAIQQQIGQLNLKGFKELIRDRQQVEFRILDLANLSISVTSFVVMFSTFSYMYFEPVQAAYFIKVYQIPQSETGLLMTISTFTYVVGTVVFGYVRLNQKKMILVGLIGTAISFVFQGPDPDFTPYEHNLGVALTFQAVLGFASSMIFIPGMPLLNNYLLDLFPGQVDRAGNMASALFNSAVSSGELLGPLVGGWMTKEFGYAKGSTLTGLAIFVIAIAYGTMILQTPKKKDKKQFSNNSQTSTPEATDLEIVELATEEL